MPLFKRKPFEKEQLNDQVLKDNQEVFYCELSKEIFVDYEEYFERTMLFNSTIWTCALSGRPNLTYAEALESEKKHRKMIEAFPQVLKGPVVFIANLTKRSAISDLVDDVFNYVNTRYFKTEKVLAKEENSEQYVECEVVGFVTPAHSSDSGPNGKIGAEDVKYRVKRIDDGKKSPMLWTVLAEHIRRKKKDNSFPFSKDKLKLFLKQCIEYNDIRMLTIKQEAYKKYVTEANISALSSFYVGKQPIFNLSKVLADKNQKDKKKKVEQKKVEKKKAKEKSSENGGAEKTPNGTAKTKKSAATASGTKEKGKKPGKQSLLDTFVTKDGEKIEDLKKLKKLEEEEMKRQKELEAERQKQLAEERKKQMAEMNLLVQATVKTMNALKDDLELQDQKPLPVAKPVQTLIPERYFADAIMVQEFIYSYTDILEDKDKFRNGIDLPIMERALLTREVAGPLSDILQVLLGSIFAFQIEESNEIHIEFEKGTIVFKENIPQEQQEFIRQATVAAVWPQKYLSSNMSDLPIDATTLSELLRLHFLTSGARLNEAGSKFRFQERGGFQNADDPGVMFCVKNKHVLRALQTKTVYELPIDDIMNVLKCLINQILTYSTVRDTVEERMETSTKSRIALRNLYSAERKREATLAAEKKEILEEVKKAMETFEGTDEEKAAQKESLDKKADVRIKQLEAVGERDKKKFTDQMEQLKREIFAYQLYLGSDRAYRSYWLFESLPGLFIEHEPFGGECIQNPVENIHGLANCAPEKRYLFIKKMLQEKQNNNISDKENKINNGVEVKPRPSDAAKALGDQQQAAAAAVAIAPEEPPIEVNYSQRDLFMCTGKTNTCPVHRFDDAARKVWTFLNTEEEINALIDSLNPRGIREKNLREQLESQKELILFHIQNCPVEKLQVDPATRDEKIEQITNDKTRAYLNANFNYPKGTNISEMMLSEIRTNILEMEFKLTAGQLGQLRVKDRLAWREAIDKLQYQMQEKFLQWGPYGQFQEDANGQIKKLQVNGKASNKKLVNGHVMENGDDGEAGSNDEDDGEDEAKVLTNISYEDPGNALVKIENGIDGIDDEITDAAGYKKQIHDLACALLQISQSIDPKYFKPPFGNLKSGGKNGTKDQNAIKAKHSLDMWQVSLMNCQNPSQLFLHYNVLYDAIKWTRSAQNAKCVCRSSKDPDKLLLCDGCNIGRHIYCLKPKLQKVPEGDWYCNRCKPNQPAPKKKRKTFVYSEDEDDNEVEASTAAEDESEDEEEEEESDDGSALDSLFTDSQSQDTSDTERKGKVCVRCNKSGRNMFSCAKCRKTYDTKCLNMRSKPDAKWMCNKCTTDNQRSKRRRGAADESDSDEEVLVTKSSKVNGEERRTSRRRAEASPPSNQRLSSTRRRGGDDLLLDNVAILRLIDEIAKHPSSWPFVRPVKTQDAPDYHKIIKHPMDTSKIKSNLNMGKYTSNYEVMKDIQLIFENCDLYNVKDSDIHNEGVTLEIFIVNKCKELNLPYTPSKMASSVALTDEPSSKRKRKM